MVRLGITAGLEVTEDGLTVSWNCNLAGDLGPHFEVTWIWEPTGTGYYPLRAFLDGVVLESGNRRVQMPRGIARYYAIRRGHHHLITAK
jgi:hypothetical protein